MSKIDFRAKYGSAGSKEVYFARLRDALGKPTLVDLIKASFGGDRSAAGRYAANMRWQGQGKVAGFVGKLKHKLGADGSIHPKALESEINEESNPEQTKRYSNANYWKGEVTKNIALSMSDVTALEIADVVTDLNLVPEDDEALELSQKTGEQMRLIQEISQSAKPSVFRVTPSGDIVPYAFSQYTEDQYVETEISKLREKMGFLHMESLGVSSGQPSDQTYEQYMRSELRIRHQKLVKDTTEYTYPSPEAEQALKEVGVSKMVKAWATSSNDKMQLSLAIQDAAQSLFKIGEALSWSDDKAYVGNTYESSTKFGNNKVLQSFVKAQYDATQQYFAAKGIKEVTLFRGMEQAPFKSGNEEEGDAAKTFDTELLMRPLSSWATSASEANSFSGHSRDSIVMKARFKAEDIFAIPLTGVGCLLENEVVVKAGSVMGAIKRPLIQYSSDPEYQQRKKEFESWAYSEETGEMPTK